MKSCNQKREGVEREPGIGTVKVYRTGIVGYQQSGQSHSAYAKAMRSLQGVTPQNGDVLLSRLCGRK